MWFKKSGKQDTENPGTSGEEAQAGSSPEGADGDESSREDAGGIKAPWESAEDDDGASREGAGGVKAPWESADDDGASREAAGGGGDEPPRILRSKFYLYLTEFFAGMSVMAVELGASRLLAPYFSSSQIVWTIIIGTIMIAMALGNLWGGRMADRHPDPDRLYRRILIASVWIATIPVLGKYIVLLIGGLVIFTVNTAYLTWAAFAACMVIFVFPLFLLGTVTPSLVRFTASRLDESGRVVGRLSAANTIGSILGTFLPTFVTIPAVGTSMSFLIFSGIPLLISLLYFASIKKKKKLCIAACIIYLICVIFGHASHFAFWEKKLTYEGESVYNYLQVKEDAQTVYLSTNVLFGVQSLYKKGGGLTGMYYDYALAAPYMVDVLNRDIDILILGMGSGTYATKCREFFGDHVDVTGVEIDQKIIDLGRRYFHVPGDARVVEYDGRAYLTAAYQQYDIILVDAYQDITIPFQFSSKEFFQLVKKHLKEDGVLVVNMNMRGQEDDDGDSITDYLADTIASEFEEVRTVDIPYTTNRALFASPKESGLIRRIKEGASGETNPVLIAQMTKVVQETKPYHPGKRILTDDRAPVELLGMQIIDQIIREELDYYKREYGIEGISDLPKLLN